MNTEVKFIDKEFPPYPHYAICYALHNWVIGPIRSMVCNHCARVHIPVRRSCGTCPFKCCKFRIYSEHKEENKNVT